MDGMIRCAGSAKLWKTPCGSPDHFPFVPTCDGLVKSRKSITDVIPAKAGIQKYHMVTKTLDPGFRRGDDFFARSSLVDFNFSWYESLNNMNPEKGGGDGSIAQNNHRWSF